jgi:DNA-binding NarL/FixJ family response regulator
MSLRVLIADDHAIVRQGIRHILEEDPDVGAEVVAEVADGREAVDRTAELHPDIAILDVAMPGLNGIEATRQIVKHGLNTRVLIVSMHGEETYVRQALKAGARGYVLKDSADAELGTAVRAVAAEGSFFSPPVASVMLDHYLNTSLEDGSDGRYDTLTDREREVVQLLAEGHSSKDIAARLTLRVATVDTHRANIFRKLKVHSLAELILYAVRRGLVS